MTLCECFIIPNAEMPPNRVSISLLDSNLYWKPQQQFYHTNVALIGHKISFNILLLIHLHF